MTKDQNSVLSGRLNLAAQTAQTQKALNDLSAEVTARPLYPNPVPDGQPMFSPDHDAFSMLKAAIDPKSGDDVRLKTLLARYQGNITLAVTASLVGSEKVGQWVKDAGDPRTGMIADQDFIEKIPDEKTRATVQRIADRMDGVANGAVCNVPSIASMAARIVNDPNLSPMARQNALSGLGTLYANQVKQRADQRFLGQKAAFDAADQNGLAPDALPGEARDALGVKGLAALREYQAAREANGGMVKTNPSYFNALPQMAASWPAALLHLDYADLRANLDDAHLAQVMTWRDQASSGKRLSDVGVNERLVSDFFASHGLKDQTAQQAMVRTDLYALMGEEEGHQGRTLSYAERQKIVDQYGMKVLKQGVVWDGETALWRLGVDDLPKGFRVAYLQQTGKKTASDDDMLSSYRRLLAQGRIAAAPGDGRAGPRYEAPMPPRPTRAQ